MSNLPSLLYIADEDQIRTYAQCVSLLDYHHISIHNLWDEKDPIVQGTAGPLNSKFVKSLTERNPQKYDLVIVDMLSEDLIHPLKQGGYLGPIIGITSYKKLTDAHISVKLGPMMSFPTRLNDSITELLKRKDNLEGLSLFI